MRQITIKGWSKFQKLLREITEFHPMINDMANFLAKNIYNDWARTVIDKSPSWASRYISTLKIQENDIGDVSVFADDENKNILFYNMVEHGVKSFDILEGIKNGKAFLLNMQMGKNYVNVPFRQRTPAKIPASSQFDNVMPGDVYQFIKGGGKMESGEFKGVVRTDSGENPGKHGGYYRWVRVTKKSKWNPHPGKMETPVFPLVEQRANNMINEFLDNFVKGYINSIHE